MATLQSNPLTSGLSGMLGRTIVFKNLRGKTIVANRPAPPSRQSEQQRVNRSKFSSASAWAHQVLADPQRKLYYQQKAIELKLPNAYTAAITDYMRTAKINEVAHTNSATSYVAMKKDFDLKKIEVVVTHKQNASKEVRMISQNEYNEWRFSLSDEDTQQHIEIRVTHASGRGSTFIMNSNQRPIAGSQQLF